MGSSRIGEVTRTIPVGLSTDVIDWARNKLALDGAYIRHQSKFGPPVIKAIATLILELGENEQGGSTSTDIKRNHG